MRRLCAVFLFLVLLALCACGRTALEPDSAYAVLTILSWLDYNETTIEDGPTIHTEAETTEGETTTYASIKTSKNDPYSYVVNAYYAIEQNPGQYFAQYPDSRSQLKDLTQGFVMLSNGDFDALYHTMYGNSQFDLYYALYDINGDGVKELLLGAGNDYGTELFDIYTIRNGVAGQLLSNATKISRMSIFKNGTVRISGGKMGYYHDNYYRFKDGQLRQCLSLPFREGWTSGDEELAFVYFKNDTDDNRNEVQISQEEYERLKHEYEGNGREVEISWRPVAEYGK